MSTRNEESSSYFNISDFNLGGVPTPAKVSLTTTMPLYNRIPRGSLDMAVARFRIPLSGVPLTQHNIPFQQWAVGLQYQSNPVDFEFVPQYNPLQGEGSGTSVLGPLSANKVLGGTVASSSWTTNSEAKITGAPAVYRLQAMGPFVYSTQCSNKRIDVYKWATSTIDHVTKALTFQTTLTANDDIYGIGIDPSTYDVYAIIPGDSNCVKWTFGTLQVPYASATPTLVGAFAPIFLSDMLITNKIDLTVDNGTLIIPCICTDDTTNTTVLIYNIGTATIADTITLSDPQFYIDNAVTMREGKMAICCNFGPTPLPNQNIVVIGSQTNLFDDNFQTIPMGPNACNPAYQPGAALFGSLTPLTQMVQLATDGGTGYNLVFTPNTSPTTPIETLLTTLTTALTSPHALLDSFNNTAYILDTNQTTGNLNYCPYSEVSESPIRSIIPIGATYYAPVAFSVDSTGSQVLGSSFPIFSIGTGQYSCAYDSIAQRSVLLGKNIGGTTEYFYKGVNEYIASSSFTAIPTAPYELSTFTEVSQVQSSLKLGQAIDTHVGSGVLVSGEIMDVNPHRFAAFKGISDFLPRAPMTATTDGSVVYVPYTTVSDPNETDLGIAMYNSVTGGVITFAWSTFSSITAPNTFINAIQYDAMGYLCLVVVDAATGDTSFLKIGLDQVTHQPVGENLNVVITNPLITRSFLLDSTFWAIFQAPAGANTGKFAVFEFNTLQYANVASFQFNDIDKLPTAGADPLSEGAVHTFYGVTDTTIQWVVLDPALAFDNPTNTVCTILGNPNGTQNWVPGNLKSFTQIETYGKGGLNQIRGLFVVWDDLADISHYSFFEIASNDPSQLYHLFTTAAPSTAANSSTTTAVPFVATGYDMTYPSSSQNPNVIVTTINGLTAASDIIQNVNFFSDGKAYVSTYNGSTYKLGTIPTGDFTTGTWNFTPYSTIPYTSPVWFIQKVNTTSVPGHIYAQKLYQVTATITEEIIIPFTTTTINLLFSNYPYTNKSLLLFNPTGATTTISKMNIYSSSTPTITPFLTYGIDITGFIKSALVDIAAQDYPIYNYFQYLAQINTALLNAFSAMYNNYEPGHPGDFTNVVAPYMTYDPTTQKFALQLDETMIPTKFKVYFNAPLQDIFQWSTLYTQPYTTSLYNNTLFQLSFTPPTTPTAGTLFSIIQLGNSLGKLNGIARVFIKTARMPINGDNEDKNSNISALTDIVPDIDSIMLGSSLIYEPFFYRKYLMELRESLFNIDIEMLYQDRTGAFYPIMIPANEFWSLKLVFLPKYQA